jgi:hypothetical protein
MSLKIENSRRKDESRPVCMDLKAGFPLAKFVARIFCIMSSRLEEIRAKKFASGKQALICLISDTDKGKRSLRARKFASGKPA